MILNKMKQRGRFSGFDIEKILNEEFRASISPGTIYTAL